MSDRKYTCSHCGETFESGWSDDEARAELKDTWAVPVEECAVVCDDCYTMMMNPDAARKKARAELADMYRKMRKDRPEMARLFWRRMKDAQKMLIDQLLFGGLIENGERSR